MAQSNTRNLSWPALDLRATGQLPTLGTVLVVLVLASLVGRGDWMEAAQLAAGALVLFSLLAAPGYLALLTMLAFVCADMWIVGGGAMNEYRWAMLLVMPLGLFLRNSMSASGSRWHPTQFSLGIFICCALISSTYSANSLLTLLKAGAFGCLLLSSLLYGRLESRGDTQSPCEILDHVYWYAALVGLGCVLAMLHIMPSGGRYFGGPFVNPNTLGAFIPMVAPVLLLRLYQAAKKEPIVRAVYGALTALYAVWLVMSRSRTGMVATFVGCAWWLYFSSRKAFIWFVAIAFMGALILFAYFPQYVESLNQVYVQKGGTYILQSRGRLLEQSWEAAKENIAFGTGFGVTKGSSEGWQFGFETGFANREKMNSLLALIEEVGLVGAIFMVYPVAWVLYASARRLKLIERIHGSEREYWTVVTLSACLISGLADTMGEAWLTGVGFFDCILFWLIFGVLSTRLTMPLRARQEQTPAS